MVWRPKRVTSNLNYKMFLSFTETNNFIIVCPLQINQLRRLRVGGATRPFFHLHFKVCSETNCAQWIALWSSVLPYGSNGRFQVRLYWYTTCGFELFLGVLLYCTERLDWVEERVCIRFVTGVKRIIMCEVYTLYIYIYIYIMTVNIMILYSINTSYIEIYLLNYSIL